MLASVSVLQLQCRKYLTGNKMVLMLLLYVLYNIDVCTLSKYVHSKCKHSMRRISCRSTCREKSKKKQLIEASQLDLEDLKQSKLEMGGGGKVLLPSLSLLGVVERIFVVLGVFFKDLHISKLLPLKYHSV